MNVVMGMGEILQVLTDAKLVKVPGSPKVREAVKEIEDLKVTRRQLESEIALPGHDGPWSVLRALRAGAARGGDDVGSRTEGGEATLGEFAEVDYSAGVWQTPCPVG